MIKYCLDKWNENKDKLEQFYKTTTGWNECNYLDIVAAVVTYVLNVGDGPRWQEKEITMIDNGDYQGTLLFLVPEDTYQPAEYEYLLTYVGYGSCSGCDTLLDIQSYEEGEYLTAQQIKDFMTLSKDIIMNFTKPYNNGWRYDENYKNDDLIEVIRCKDCIYYNPNHNKLSPCTKFSNICCQPNDFCSRGEK